MLKATHRMDINLSQPDVWHYLENWPHWAKQVPGYQSHRNISAVDSIWKLHGKAGSLTKEVTLYVKIIDMTSPSIVQFRVRDSENRCLGNGCLELARLSARSSTLTCLLEIELKGLTGKMSAPLVGSLLPGLLEKFVHRITQPLMEADSVALPL